jgi:uncharacterized membrane protein (DUF4010 family)
MTLAVALGVGLLIGGERERRKRDRASSSFAGLRTFTVASLTGAVSFALGGAILLAVSTAAVAVFAAAAGRGIRDKDPGITTEIALVLTVLVGALAVREPVAAAGVGVTLAILLAARTPMHRFVGSVLTQAEVRDILIFAGASLVVLPLLPDRPVGPFGAFNPHTIWIVGVLMLAIGAAGHAAVRLLGARFGLPIAGLASGFVSSIATIAAMGARAVESPAILSAAAAAAVLSTVATIAEMAAVIAATSVPTLRALGAPLVCAGLAAAGYGVLLTVRALRKPGEDAPPPGSAFNLAATALLAVTLSVVLFASAALRHWFGEAGSLAAAALAGLVDTHAAAISIAALVASGQMRPEDSVLPILAGFSTNTVTKLVVAGTSGGPGFAIRVVPGLILVVIAAWAGALAMAALG